MGTIAERIDVVLDRRADVPGTTRRLFRDLTLELAVLQEEESLELVFAAFEVLTVNKETYV